MKKLDVIGVMLSVAVLTTACSGEKQSTAQSDPSSVSSTPQETTPQETTPQETATKASSPRPTTSRTSTPPQQMSPEVFQSYMHDSGLLYDRKQRTVTVTFHGEGPAAMLIDKADLQYVSLPYTTDITTGDSLINATGSGLGKPISCSAFYQGKLLIERAPEPDNIIQCSVPGQLLEDIDKGKVVL